MGSTASYPARQLRRRRTGWMRRNVRIVVLLIVGTLVLGALVSVVLLLTIPMPGRFYVLGVAHAGLIAAGLHLVNSAFLAHDQQAVWQLSGAWGEDTPEASSIEPSASVSGGGSTASNFGPATSTTSS